ncbi:MAG: ribonuclease H family protein [Gorillibacterium sp.]|nr:ribonuclease H family protein [Gorillibacterium sp.]
MAKEKFYVVWAGKRPGIYTNWAECQEQVNHFFQAKFKSYDSKSQAEEAYKAGWEKHWGQGAKQGDSKNANKSSYPSKSRTSMEQISLSGMEEEIDFDTISVDVGTSGNPGPTEYKGVDTRTGEIIFSVGPVKKGTNNLGEFLAIVHALALLKKTGSKKNVYSDSVNAIKWVNQKSISSTLVRDSSTEEIWLLVDRAVHWLKTNTYETKVMKWHTRKWGEIKADYGRK